MDGWLESVRTTLYGRRCGTAVLKTLVTVLTRMYSTIGLLLVL